MKLGFCLALVLVALALVGTAAGRSAGSWIPGTSYLVEESDMEDLLDDHFDHATCRGVPRFGHRGSFPDEEYVVFDCTVEIGSAYCPGTRVKSVKDRRRGYFRMRWIVKPSARICF